MNAPQKIYNWLDTQLSLAQHYGGIAYNGHEYQIDYLDPELPLVRLDIFKAEAKAKTLKAKAARKEQAARQKQEQVALI